MITAQRIWLTGICWLAIISLLLFCHFKERRLPNGFNRGPIYRAQQLQVLDLKYNSWYLAGLGYNRIYLGNTTAPLGRLSCSYNLQDTLHERLPFSPDLKRSWQAVRLQVEAGVSYLVDRKTPIDGMHFDLMQLLSPGSVIVNGYDPALQQKSIRKVLLEDRPAVYKLQSYVHQVQEGGNFSIDGFITCNRSQNAVFFTYYYRNQFICLDTNLKLRYIGKTIDTNSLAKLKTKTLEVMGKIVESIAGMPAVVSKRAYSDGKLMYIQAGLQADNEKWGLFDKPVVVDVYKLEDGSYSHSIYLPKYKREALIGFAVRDNLLFALHGRYLVSYNIDIHKIPLKI